MLLSLLNLVLRRSLGHWKLLAVVAVGVVVAAALTASTAIYSDAIRDLGLSYALKQTPKLDLDVQILNSSVSAKSREYGQRRQTVLGTVGAYTGPYVKSSVEYGKSSTFFLTPPGEAVPQDDNRPRSFFQYVQNLPEHVRTVDGQLNLHTEPAKDPSQPPTLNAVVGKETADSFNLHVGDSFDMHPFWHLEVQPVKVVIGGIIEPKDLSEEYWFGKNDRFAVTTTTWRTYPFFIDQQSMSEVVAGYLPDMSTDYTTFLFVNTAAINARNATKVRIGFSAVANLLRQSIERTTIDTKLPDTIQTFQQKLFFTRLPLFALIMQVVGIVLYYIVMVSTMLVDRQAGEIALFKSRGASTRQIMTVYAIEGGVIALLGVALGPPLAGLIVKLLGLTPPFHGLSGGHLLAVHISTQAYELAIAGSALSLLALLWPAFRASRFSMVLYKQTVSRPQQGSVFTRYYLDVFLIIVGGLLFYELRQRGSLVTKQVFGGLKADPLLLATPALFTLMIALLFLRLFPLLLRLIVRLLGELSGTSILLGLWHIVRSPVHYSRLILLLILATSLGMFAAGFRATLDRSYQDRASYQAGAELRVQGVRQPSISTPNDVAPRVGKAINAATVSPVLRTNVSYSARLFSSVDGTVLGIDPDSFGKVAYWRDDFSSHSLAGIERTLAKNDLKQQPGVSLPDGARWIGVWVNTPSSNQGYGLAMRLSDRNGRILDYALNSQQGPQPAPGGWTFFYAPLEQPGTGFPGRPGPPPAQPLRFLSLYVRSRNSQQPETIQDFFDDLQVSSDSSLGQGPQGFANPTIVDDFENIDGLEVLNGLQAKPVSDTFNRAETQAHGGKASAELTWSRDRSGVTTHGFRAKDDGQPLDAFVSQSFLDATGLHTGQVVSMYLTRAYGDVRIAGVFSYFPTYAADLKQNFLVVNLNRLQYDLNRIPSGSDSYYANEAWAAGPGIAGDPEGALRKANLTADQVVSLASIRANQQRDPLVAASWEGILFLAFIAVLLLTALGFTVYSYLTARARSLEFAVLRTMGLSTPQIVAVVSFEQVFVVLAGVITGTILGLPLGRLMLGFMGLTETGDTVVPPFVSRVSWQALVTSYAGLAVVFVAAIIALVLLYARLSVSRVLRMGEV